MNNLGKEIRKIRGLLGISLRTLAASVYISPAFLSDIELGRRFPAEKTLRRIASSLAIDYESLHSLLLSDKPTIEHLQSQLAQSQARIESLEAEISERKQDMNDLFKVAKKHEGEAKRLKSIALQLASEEEIHQRLAAINQKVGT